LENGPYSPWLDWFKIQGWPLAPYDGDRPANYEGWVGNRALPVFNHDNPAVKEYILEIAEYWLKFGIDGWRLDVPFEIKTPGFWQDFRDRVKAVNPEAYIVGEVWGDSRQWLDGTQFDGVMNYLFTGPTIAFAAGDRVQRQYVEAPNYQTYPALDAAGYAAKIQELLQLYPWEIQLTQLNLLASHDTARLMTIAGGDVDSIKLSTLLLLTFPGAPSIYYGDEVGLAGGIDPDSRRSFPPEANWNLDLLKCHQELVALRHRYPALRTGSYQVLLTEGLVYAFVRSLHDISIIVAVNAGTTAAEVNLAIANTNLSAEQLRVLYGNAELKRSEQNITLELPARSGCVLGVGD
jgi:cyclomaltodextrinase / maltogenic alpha-amylase / neopullulanase